MKDYALPAAGFVVILGICAALAYVTIAAIIGGAA